MASSTTETKSLSNEAIPLPSSSASSSSSSLSKSNESNMKLKATNKSHSSSSDEDDTNKNKKEDSTFECNICLDTAKDAVVSMCGHLFCWPCLHQWLETRPSKQLCPVCKAAISAEKVIPLYGRGSTKQEDPRTKTPPRPAGQRTEAESGGLGFQGFGFGDGTFHMSFGIGAFPFGFFTSTFNFGDTRPAAATRGTIEHIEEQYLSKAFLWIATIFLTWLILA